MAASAGRSPARPGAAGARLLLLAAWVAGAVGSQGGRVQRLAVLAAELETAEPKATETRVHQSEGAGIKAVSVAQEPESKPADKEGKAEHFSELKDRMAELTKLVSTLERRDRENNMRLESLEKSMEGSPHSEMKKKLDAQYDDMSNKCEQFKTEHPEERVSEEELKKLQDAFGKCVNSVWQFAQLTKRTQKESHRANTDYHNSEEPFIDTLKELEDHKDERDGAVRADYATVNKLFDESADKMITQIKEEFPGIN